MSITFTTEDEALAENCKNVDFNIFIIVCSSPFMVKKAAA